MATRGKRSSRGHSRHGPPPKTNKPEDVDVSSPVMQAFLKHRLALDTRHDKYERVVKLSRDITVSSKRVIFLLHRAMGENKERTLTDAHAKLKEIQENLFRKVAEELYSEDPHRFTRAYSPGLQEYVEAISFCKYMDDGSLIRLEDVEKDLVFSEKVQSKAEDKGPGESQEDNDSKTAQQETPQTSTNEESSRTIKVYVSPLDYVLGLADLTGELMRLSITSVGKGDLELPFKVCGFMRQMHDAFVSLGNIDRELPRKLSVLKQSLRKVENACYTIQVRGSEFPKSMLLNMIEIEDSESAASRDIS